MSKSRTFLFTFTNSIDYNAQMFIMNEKVNLSYQRVFPVFSEQLSYEHSYSKCVKFLKYEESKEGALLEINKIQKISI